MFKKFCLMFLVLILPMNFKVYAEEDATEESISETEEIVKLPYESEKFCPHWLKEIYESKAQPNKQLDIAFKDYQTIIEDYEIRSLNDFEEEGTTLEDFMKSFESEVEPSKQDLGNGMTALFYQYKDPEPSETLPLEEWAEIMVYFENNRLTHVGIGTLSFYIDKKTLTPAEDYNQFKTVEDLQNMTGHLYGLSVSNFNGEPIFSLLVPTGNDTTTGKGMFTIIYNGEIVDVNEQPIIEVMQNGPNYYFEATIIEAINPTTKVLQ